ncbi:MAG: hypothetical protein C4294_06230, partial [Nitrospiraceae bacterium]
EIVQDERHPLTNRATQGQYPPGSTFKIVMAAAALETGTVQPSTKIRCTGGYQFGKRIFRDWKIGGHGPMDVNQALVHSCDVYFYTVGQRMGIDTIASYAAQFGLGQETGIDLPSERVGIVPSPSWKEKVRHEPWFPGETISAAIGQGYVTVTPLQMAHLIGTVANNGISYRPRLVKAVMDRATGQLVEIKPEITGRLSVKRDTLKVIQEGLAGVVTERRHERSLCLSRSRERPGPRKRLRCGRDRRRIFPRSSAIMPGLSRMLRLKHHGLPWRSWSNIWAMEA